MKLSVVIPIFNEKRTISTVIDTINSVDLGDIDKEIIMVDDGSTDGTRNILQGFENKYKVIYHEKNKGKGSAMKTGIKVATGDMVVIQDADLEYDPNDYPVLLNPILSGKADFVLGIRDKRGIKPVSLTASLGSRLITLVTNILYFRRTKDYLGGYKVFTKKLYDDIEVKTDNFDFDTELMCKALRRGYKIGEAPIKYRPRSYEEGKKINFKHGFTILWTTIKYRFLSN